MWSLIEYCSPHSGISDLSRFWLFCLDPIIHSQRPLAYLAFQSFDVQRTWWRLFEKRVVCTKLDVYVFMHALFISFILL
jgi:hypothetical protein